MAIPDTMYSHGAKATGNLTYVSEFTRGLTGVDVKLDRLLGQLLCATIGGICVVVLCVRFFQIGHSYLRQVIAISSTPQQQRFWAVESSSLWANIKRHLLLAP